MAKFGSTVYILTLTGSIYWNITKLLILVVGLPNLGASGTLHVFVVNPSNYYILTDRVLEDLRCSLSKYCG